MTQHDSLLKAVQDAHIFKRNKISIDKDKISCLFVLHGWTILFKYDSSDRHHTFLLSLCPLVGVTAQRDHIESSGKGEKVRSNCNTKHKINGKQLSVWSAIDIETKELLAIWATYQMSSFDAYMFES